MYSKKIPSHHSVGRDRERGGDQVVIRRSGVDDQRAASRKRVSPAADRLYRGM
jgi:hypothetical protein